MRITKNGDAVYARVVKRVTHRLNTFYVLKYITEEGGPTYMIEMPVTMRNRHLKEGDDVELQMLMKI